MLRNYLAAAIRNLRRNRLQTFITVGGLALGLTAALFTLLYVLQQTSYDRFIPGSERVHVMTLRSGFQGRFFNGDRSPAPMASWVREDFQGLDVTRLMPGEAGVRGAQVEATENIGWVDPNFFSLLPLPVVDGDLRTALARPDGLVISRRMALKYFGRERPIGETLEIGRRQTVQVTAVLENPPAATHLVQEIFGSALNPDFGLAPIDASTFDGNTDNPVLTYVAPRAGGGMTIAGLQAAMPEFVTRRLGRFLARTETAEVAITLVPVPGLHLHPADMQYMKPHMNPAALRAIGLTGLLIVLVGAVNFINLMTALSARRAVEVGVRKMSGAERRQLVVQFIGEAAIYAALALILALGAVRLLLPLAETHLAPGLGEQFLTAPMIAAAAVVAAVVAVLAGAYPAFVLASYRPAAVLKGRQQPKGSAALRQGLAIVQFGVLVGLLLATLVIWRQTGYALRDGLRVSGEQMLLVYGDCTESLRGELGKIPGVVSAACSNRDPLNTPSSLTEASVPGGAKLSVGLGGVGFGYFEAFKVAPLAGRVFEESRDAAVAGPQNVARVVLNESAVRAFGFTSPEDAVGRRITLRDASPEVIGVVPDYTFNMMRRAITPAAYWVGTSFSSRFAAANLRLSGERIPETLEAIDGVWNRVGPPQPVRRLFVDQTLEAYYADVMRQGSLIGALAATASVIACLGLFGLSAFMAEQRMKEIGIRKSMGADRADVVRLLLWKFMKPVLWANLIAWPLAYVAMRRWLEGFAYHIELSPWMFVAASALALVIAFATVVGHALGVARAHPVTALRYE